MTQSAMAVEVSYIPLSGSDSISGLGRVQPGRRRLGVSRGFPRHISAVNLRQIHPLTLCARRTRRTQQEKASILPTVRAARQGRK